MPRWRLTAGHYLMVPGTEWEYREVNDKGKQSRKIFEVPAYLHPDDPGDHNYPGEIIVGQEPCEPKDIIFFGPPTPDMAPLDEAAQAMSDKESVKWTHPIENVSVGRDDVGNALRDIAAINASSKASGTVPREEFDELKAQLAALLATQPKSERRV
jgi:hypothetical protein